jgi:hypothetical protein
MMGRQKRDGNLSPPQNKLVQDSEEIKKMDTQIHTPTNKDKLYQGTQQNPQEHP